MIGKIINLISWYSSVLALIGLSLLFAASVFFELTCNPTARVSRINGTGAARICRYRPNVYQELWNLPIASILISFIVYL
jgi:ABC-2 type transport system permease protein